MNLSGAWCHDSQGMGGIGGKAGKYEYCSSWGQAVMVSWGFGDMALWVLGGMAFG